MSLSLARGARLVHIVHVPRRPALRGRRSQAESARTRQRILDCAERLFARKSYRGVGTREVARVAGVQPYTIQHHFGSKLGLFEAVLGRWDEVVRTRITDEIAQLGDVRSVVTALLGELLDFFLEHRDWVTLSVRNTLGEGLPRRVEASDRTWARFIEASLQATGRPPPPVDVRLLLITIEGVLHNHVLSGRRYRVLFGKDLTDPALRQRVKRHLERSVLALLDADADDRARGAEAPTATPTGRPAAATSRPRPPGGSGAPSPPRSSRGSPRPSDR